MKLPKVKLITQWLGEYTGNYNAAAAVCVCVCVCVISSLSYADFIQHSCSQYIIISPCS